MDKKEKYMNAIIAVPTSGQGGLDAPCSPHFGRCECFTVIEVENGEPKEVVVAFNPPHGQGDCLGPVDLLVSKSVNALIVRGIGMRGLLHGEGRNRQGRGPCLCKRRAGALAG